MGVWEQGVKAWSRETLGDPSAAMMEGTHCDQGKFCLFVFPTVCWFASCTSLRTLEGHRGVVPFPPPPVHTFLRAAQPLACASLSISVLSPSLSPRLCLHLSVSLFLMSLSVSISLCLFSPALLCGHQEPSLRQWSGVP